MKKIKRFQETSRGGRRQLLVKNKFVRGMLESVARQSGESLQLVFDEFMEMIFEGYVLGVETHNVLFVRVVSRASKSNKES